LAFNLPDHTSIETENVVVYIAGFIAKRLCEKNILCPDCNVALIGTFTGDANQTFLREKQHDGALKGLTLPSQCLVSTVLKMEEVFLGSEECLYRDKVRERFLSKMTMAAEGDSLRCLKGVCSLAQCTAGLYLSIRLKFALRDCNRQNAATSKRKNRKILHFSYL
jgi:hypothetical protein